MVNAWSYRTTYRPTQIVDINSSFLYKENTTTALLQWMWRRKQLRPFSMGILY